MLAHLALAALLAAGGMGMAWAAVDANRASEAELDGVRGIGPDLSGRILAQRRQAPFQDWGDFIARVRGMGPARAARLSAEGLTVNGQPYGAHPAPEPPTAPPQRP